MMHGTVHIKSIKKSQVSVRSDKNNRHFTLRPINIFVISRSVLLRMRNSSNKFVVKNTTHILFSITFFLDTELYKHTFRICNTNFFSNATMVGRTHLNVTLHLHGPF